MATTINDRFYELVNRTVVSHVCNHEEVIEVCSQWFITEKRELSELPRLLEVYGDLRDLGHDHGVVLRSLTVMLNPTAFPVTTSMTATPMELDELGVPISAEPIEITSRLNNLREHLEKRERTIQQKVVDEDVRLIRNE